MADDEAFDPHNAFRRRQRMRELREATVARELLPKPGADGDMPLPRDWSPLPHQQALWAHMVGGGRRAVAVWHRRAGKDSVALNWTAKASQDRVGIYWHMLPQARQGRKVIWDGIDRQGRRMIDQAFPRDLRLGRPHDMEMRLRLRNGSVWQVLGSDNYDSLVGSNPVGVVFSEFALAKPSAWDYLRPILAENGGWALFIFTPRGENHAHDLYLLGQSLPDWFVERQTVDDTGILGPEVIAEERRSGMPESMIQQEYYCSFAASLVGSYFGSLLDEAEKGGRVTDVPWEPTLPVHTAWDLGIGDSTVIWFFQVVGQEVRLIDHYENHGQALGHYTQILKERGYKYGDDWLPHDAKVRELGTGRTRLETLKELGRRPRLVPHHTLADGINAARQTLPRCWFDRTRCATGLKALRHYQRDWAEDRHCFSDTPRHDWTSHTADAFRYLAMAWRALAPAPPADSAAPGMITRDIRLNDLWNQVGQRSKRI